MLSISDGKFKLLDMILNTLFGALLRFSFTQIRIQDRSQTDEK